MKNIATTIRQDFIHWRHTLFITSILLLTLLPKAKFAVVSKSIAQGGILADAPLNAAGARARVATLGYERVGLLLAGRQEQESNGHTSVRYL